MNPKNYLGEGLSLTSVKSEPQGVEQKPDTALLQEGQPLDVKQASEVQPFILFGSSFPKDKEYTQVGVTLILKGWPCKLLFCF